MERTRVAQGPYLLSDRRSVWLRPVTIADAARLADLCQRLSPETIRRRFLRENARCDPRELERLASVDQVTRVAIAVLADPNEDSPILAVGRFHRHDADAAELALVVRDDYQHVGIGRLLLTRLLEEAARRHLRAFDGYVLYDNAPVLRLLRTSARPLQVNWYGGDVLKIELTLEPVVSAA